MMMKKLCQGAVVFTVLSVQSSAFAVDAQVQKNAKVEESRVESKASLFGLVLPDIVISILDDNELEHSGNQPIC